MSSPFPLNFAPPQTVRKKKTGKIGLTDSLQSLILCCFWNNIACCSLFQVLFLKYLHQTVSQRKLFDFVFALYHPNSVLQLLTIFLLKDRFSFLVLRSVINILGPVQMLKFTCAESNANKREQ